MIKLFGLQTEITARILFHTYELPYVQQDYMKGMQDMHQKMMAANDADADRAWALKMIEHHRGAIAMSEAVLKHGDDAEAKQMAQKSAEMQRKEIAELRAAALEPGRTGIGDVVGNDGYILGCHMQSIADC